MKRKTSFKDEGLPDCTLCIDKEGWERVKFYTVLY